MGLDYSFLVVTGADRVDPLLESVAAGLAPDDEARLRAALPWSPSIDQFSEWLSEPPARDRRGISNLRRQPEELGESYCFTFHFARDEALTEYERSCSMILQPRHGRVSIGCVWCSLRAGGAWAVFQATAATSDMSRLFERSASVRSFWSRVSTEAGATALFFDFEDVERWEALYPTVGQVARPDEELYELENALHLNIDAYFAEALRRAGISP